MCTHCAEFVGDGCRSCVGFGYILGFKVTCVNHLIPTPYITCSGCIHHLDQCVPIVQDLLGVGCRSGVGFGYTSLASYEQNLC